MFIVLVTGSRTWWRGSAVWATLDRIAEKHGMENVVVRHGGAQKGADAWAHAWVVSRGDPGKNEDVMRPEWDRGRRAGFERNLAMVRKEPPPDECHAFLMFCTLPRCRRRKPHRTHGGAHCAAEAKEAGVPTVLHYGA